MAAVRERLEAFGREQHCGGPALPARGREPVAFFREPIEKEKTRQHKTKQQTALLPLKMSR